ncbi:uncharacterized protein F5891DRAFT_1245729 [Suillus fuscotomentosus]|uniref:Uncharacterized protein n=1 Tax=Suillus fuscotomentosus TaxID=1912939 RepID=A0AAD4E1V1_9AGAM|nr:uncharacterized protein F5891DRAFT_1245729 [Suillus fuscotomentosus]KAG1896748.1 hypothetical protein F5891DRAFT_1245729 [Suillus fuscotomentosus]
MHSFLAVAPYRAPGQEFTHRYLLAKLSTSTEQMPSKAFRHAPSLAGYLCEDDHPATLVRESRRCEPDGTNMRILSVSSNNASLQSTSHGKALATIYVGTFDLANSGVLVSYSFFELSRTSIDVHRLRREAHFDLFEISTLQIVKYPFVSNLANYVNALPSKDSQTEEYDRKKYTHLFRGPWCWSFFTSMDEMISVVTNRTMTTPSSLNTVHGQDNETVPREDVLGVETGTS